MNQSTHWDSRQRSGAQALIEQLRESGLIGSNDTLTMGNPGSGEEWLYLELGVDVSIALAEAAVGSIIDGASRVLNKPAVAIAHGFVGFSGLQGDVFNAAQRQSPMLVIVGVADSHAHTGGSHMYADVESAALSAGAKYVKNATDSKTLIRDLRDAIIQAQLQPSGPVVFIVGTNVCEAPNHESIFAPSLSDTRIAPPSEEIQKLADMLLEANKPCLLIGDGIARSKAQPVLQKVAELIGADVWASMESEVNFPRHHPLFAGNLGHMDDARGQELLKEADCILAIGTPVYQTVFNSKERLVDSSVPIATINLDPHSVLKGHNDVLLPIFGDPQRVLTLLGETIESSQSQDHQMESKERCERSKVIRSQQLKERQNALLLEEGVTMAKFAHVLEEKLGEFSERPVIFNEALVGAIGLTDFIHNVNIPGKYFDTSGGSLGEWAGAVGSAFVVGPTIAIIGDGGFNYVPQALWNAAQSHLPIGFVVANNSEYGLLTANLASALKKRNIDSATIPSSEFLKVPNVDYAKIAQGYGVKAIKVDDEKHMDDAVSELLKFDGPMLIDLVVK